jgi:hypothetical protein
MVENRVPFVRLTYTRIFSDISRIVGLLVFHQVELERFRAKISGEFCAARKTTDSRVKRF